MLTRHSFPPCRAVVRKLRFLYGAWVGSCEAASVTLPTGGLVLRCSLESLCDRESQKEWVIVDSFMPAADAGLPFGTTKFDATFETLDGLDARASRGWAKMSGLSVADGGWRLSYVHITLGDAELSEGSQAAEQIGFDVGGFIASGRSWVKDSGVKCCN